MAELKWNTVEPYLKSCLLILMQDQLFENFRLVGGTALSLQLGHRKSIDIGLFSDMDYGSIDFKQVDAYLKQTFPIVISSNFNTIGFGKSYFIGISKDQLVKLDVYTTDPFHFEYKQQDQLRLASLLEIATMKLEVVLNGGRKKDFWDLHELLEYYPLNELIECHKKKYTYTHDQSLLLKNLTNFFDADQEPDPLCLKGKYWEIIKLDLMEEVSNFFSE